MILLYSLDVRAGRSYHSICPDHRFGIDHQRFLEEICGSRPLADCQEGHPERISGKDSSSFASIREIIFILIIFAFSSPKKWCPVLLGWLCTSIGISIAWKIQTVLSAFASALAGGLIMSRAMLHVLSKGTTGHNETRADEVASYAFAALGFYFQYSLSFNAPFPLNIILFPVELTDYCIRWAVTKE